MIQYTLNMKLTRLSGNMHTDSEGISVKILTSEEYTQHYRDTPEYPVMLRNLSHIHCCKADVLGGCAAGTFAVPRKESPTAEKLCFCFFLTDSELLFIDDKDTAAPLLSQLEDMPLTGPLSSLGLLFDLMEYLIKDDVFFLQNYEEHLTRLEERLLDGEDDNFDRAILHIRKELTALGSYYEQLADMGESLQEALPDMAQDRSSVLFGLFTDRAGRLYSNVQTLKEYSMQLREMHQSQIDVRQNQIMKVLTIVTTFFMPLSLIAGWYGMNFVNMPELTSSSGYGVVILVCLLIIVIELWFFHKKKWFD